MQISRRHKRFISPLALASLYVTTTESIDICHYRHVDYRRSQRPANMVAHKYAIKTRDRPRFSPSPRTATHGVERLQASRPAPDMTVDDYAHDA